jgi:hypothetical protein
MTIEFWSNEPAILLNKEYMLDLWPTSDMCYEQKLNAISRLIILVTILGYILTMSIKLLVVGIITLAVIFGLFYMKKQKVTKEMLKEGFTIEGDNVLALEAKMPNDVVVNPVTLESVLKSEFKEGNKKNPFSNVLLTQINDEPNRKAAPPSFNPQVEEDITTNVKKAVQFMNPGIKNTNFQLYGDLWENFELDQSNRVFFTTANTRVSNDQEAFGKYLYGVMPSAKGSTMEDNIQREKDNYRYLLY